MAFLCELGVFARDAFGFVPWSEACLVNKIVEKFQPEKIVLFGSYAWGTPGPDSDVDLLIIKETDNSRWTAREIDGYLFPRPFPIDLIVYTSQQVEKRKEAGDFFITDILARGKVLYAR
jgi:predicted nucleotidyltransferase